MTLKKAIPESRSVVEQHLKTVLAINTSLEKRLTEMGDENRKLAAEQREVNQRLEGARKNLADLKQRLATAEFECQRMRGYIARVQEDDVVREEMVTVGDPEGVRHLKPKRQHASFQAPNHFDHGSTVRVPSSEDLFMSHQGPRAARHWITYGEST